MNEREEFYKACSELLIPTMEDTFKMFQHQQEIITNLDERLQHIVADNMQLQAKLNVAVEALEFICEPLSTGEHIIAENALAKINKIGK
jgi:hypothetical protein